MTQTNTVAVLIGAPNEGDDVRNLRIILEYAKTKTSEARAAGNPMAERCAVRQMLSGLIDLFEQDSEIRNGGLTEPLFDLFQALTELDLGRKPTLFQPEKKSGDKRSWIEDHIKGLAAAFLEMERRLNKSTLKDAAARIAWTLEKAGFCPGKKMTATTVIKWRERCMGHHTNEPPEMMLEGFNASCISLAQRRPDVVQEDYAHLEEFVRRMWRQ